MGGSRGFLRVLSSNPVLPVAILDATYAKSIAEIDQVIKSTNYPLLFSSFSFPSFSPANFDRSHATWALGVLGAAHMHGNPIALRPHTAARYARRCFTKKKTRVGRFFALGVRWGSPLVGPWLLWLGVALWVVFHIRNPRVTLEPYT